MGKPCLQYAISWSCSPRLSNTKLNQSRRHAPPWKSNIYNREHWLHLPHPFHSLIFRRHFNPRASFKRRCSSSWHTIERAINIIIKKRLFKSDVWIIQKCNQLPNNNIQRIHLETPWLRRYARTSLHRKAELWLTMPWSW